MTSPTDDRRAGWQLVVHGGAGMIDRNTVSAEQDLGIRAALTAALAAGSDILRTGGSALDAVEAAIRILEDDPHFNAARGAVLTSDGKVELDAAIMDGSNRAAGAVAGIGGARNPIALARAVMEHSPHVMLTREGADAFAREQGIEAADEQWFATPDRRAQLAELKARGDTFDVDMKYGTVGAVALDAHGHVAAGTSTGGVTGKRWGRVGDSPIIGAGTYADDRACAVSATGSGEIFLRAVAAHEIAARIRLRGESARSAADAVIADVGTLGGKGGVIVVTPAGETLWAFNTPGMYRGRASAAGSSVAIYGDD